MDVKEALLTLVVSLLKFKIGTFLNLVVHWMEKLSERTPPI